MKMTIQAVTPFTAGKPIPIPPALQKYVLPWMPSVQCLQFGFGLLLQQVFTHTHYHIHYIVLHCVETGALVFTENQPVVSLQLLLRGTIRSLLYGHTSTALFQEHTFRPVYAPAGSNTSYFEKGITESLHFDFSPHYPALFAKEFELLQELPLRLGTSSDKLLLLPALPIDYQVSDTIQNELFLLKNDVALHSHLQYIIYKLFWLYHHASNRQIPAAATGSPYEILVQQIREEIRKAPNKTLHTNLYFAHKYHVSAPTLRRAFKASCGMTLPEFRQEQCMRKALSLLAEGHLTMEAIAVEIGYSSRSSLSIALKAFEQKSNAE